MLNFKKILFKNIDLHLKKLGLIPEYTEFSLFLMSVTVLLLLIFIPEARTEIMDFWEETDIALFFAWLIGMVIAVRNSFFKRQATQTEKSLMLFFAIMANFLAGIHAGLYTLKQAEGITKVFPAINLINVLLLILMFAAEVITTESISDKQAKIHEVIGGAILVPLIFLISRYLFHDHWAITYSICITYATNLNSFFFKKVRGLFSKN